MTQEAEWGKGLILRGMGIILFGTAPGQDITAPIGSTGLVLSGIRGETNTRGSSSRDASASKGGEIVFSRKISLGLGIQCPSLISFLLIPIYRTPSEAEL